MRHGLSFLISLTLGCALSAQAPGPGGPPPGSAGGPPPMTYDSSREQTLQGTVTAVSVATQGPGAFVTLGFLAGGSTYQVLAGPEARLKQSGVSFATGDTLTVVGVAQDGPRGAMVMARVITRGDLVVTLLAQDGRPTR